MRPAAAVNALRSGQDHQIQNGTVDGITVEPVINTCAHDNHGSAACINCVLCKFAGDLHYDACFHRRNTLLPRRSIMGRFIIIVFGVKRAVRAGNPVLAKHQIIDSRYITFSSVSKPQFAGWNHPAERAVAGIVEEREYDFCPFLAMAFNTEGRLNLTAVFILKNQVPLLAFFPALAHRAVRDNHFTGCLIIDDRLPVRMRRAVSEVACPQEASALPGIFMRIKQNQERHIRILLGIIQEHRLLPLLVEFTQNDMRHGLGYCRIRARIRCQPVVGEFHILRQVRCNRDNLGSLVADLSHKVGIRCACQRDIRAPHDQIAGIVPV
ncbi:hypothetical protein D3C75_323370 [compost metagenome]